MGDRRVFRLAAYDGVVRTLAAAAQGRGEAWLLACKERAERAALLEAALRRLSEPPRRFACVLGSCRAPLDLDGFVAQALGRPRAEASSEDHLVAVSELLTGGQGAGRALLVVDGAEHLTPQVIRYIQFACRSAPDLQVIFAGAPAFRELLSRDEFAFLRRRLRPDLVVPYFSDEEVRITFEDAPSLAAATTHASVIYYNM